MLLIFAVFFALIAFAWLARAFTRRTRNLPPGPPRLPIIGNLHQAPALNPWRTYHEWNKQYGPIFSLQYGLSTIIMLGTHEAAHDLLDKRNSIYSSRPRLVMGGECVSKGYRTLLMTHGPQWRSHHRLQSTFLNIRVSQNYRKLQELESLQLVHDLLADADFAKHFHRFSSSLIFAMAYGRRILRGDEREVQDIDQVMSNFVVASQVGTWIVDALPVLNYLPKFLAPWRRHGDELHDFEAKLFTDMLLQGQQAKSWNWARQAQSTKERQQMSDKELAYSIGVLYEAGSDTTAMAMEDFTLAMLLHPNVMKKAQAELETVLGTSFPTIDHRDKLPYIDAIIKESLRWRPVVPGGFPHCVEKDDEYMGYHIPAGATVIANVWSLEFDATVFPNPDQFRPERWIENPDLPSATFGFGRRVYLGQHIAKNSLFINVARILWTFDIGHAYHTVNGKKQCCEVDSLAFTQGFLSRPEPFEASFTPRKGRAEVVRRLWDGAEKNLDVVMGREPIPIEGEE